MLQVSKYGGPAWTFDESRQQYYYHYYHSSMPDLNVRHEDVRNEILASLVSLFDGYLFQLNLKLRLLITLQNYDYDDHNYCYCYCYFIIIIITQTVKMHFHEIWSIDQRRTD